MGPKKSKPVAEPVSQVRIEQQPKVISENSSGFHLLELHMPTRGASIMGIALFLLLSVLILWCYKRFTRRWVRRDRQNPHMWPANGIGGQVFYLPDRGLPMPRPPPYDNNRFREVNDADDSAENQQNQQNNREQWP